MSEEQKKACEPFVKKANEMGVHINICLWALGSVIKSEDWKTTLDDIAHLLDISKDGDDFSMRLLKKYPGQKVAPEA